MTAPILHTGEKGTAYGWYVLKCKCPECEQAMHAKKRKHRPKGNPRGGQIKPLPEHGTKARYSHNREPCRCPQCTEANRLAHYFYKDGRPKANRVEKVIKAIPSKSAITTKRRPLSELHRPAKPLRIMGLSDKLRNDKPRSYEPEAADLCGLDLPHGGFCMKRLPCPRPEHQ